MDWQKEFLNLCTSLNIEPQNNSNPIASLMGISTSNSITLICPKRLKPKEKAKLMAIIPTAYNVKFEEGPKPSSLNAVGQILARQGYDTKRPLPAEIKNRMWGIKCMGMGYPGCEEGPKLDPVHKILSEDGYFDSWTIEVNGNIVERHFPRIAEDVSKNNAIRETIIKQDDVTDLRITLENCKTIDDLLKELS